MSESNLPHGPLTGVRVVDLTRAMAGPYCTMMLGDMGADVIKIEHPNKGDDTRGWGPPFVQTAADATGDNRQSAYFLSVNRNKRSVTLDLKNERDQQKLWQLIADADVVVENFSPGTMARLGFAPAQLREKFPRLIVCSISGFGQDGPSAQKTAYDLILQGMSGLMSLTGPEGEPYRLGIPIADISTGMFAAFAIVCALHARQQTGSGDYIDTSMLGSQVALLTYQATSYFATQQVPQTTGNAHPMIAPYQTFATKDGHINIAVGNDDLWRKFTTALELTTLATDARFQLNEGRVRHRTELAAAITAAFAHFTCAEILARMEAAGVPCGPIYDVKQVFDDPQTQHLGLRQTLPHATLGTIDVPGLPYRFTNCAPSLRHGPPTLGQHTADAPSSKRA